MSSFSSRLKVFKFARFISNCSSGILMLWFSKMTENLHFYDFDANCTTTSVPAYIKYRNRQTAINRSIAA